MAAKLAKCFVLAQTVGAAEDLEVLIAEIECQRHPFAHSHCCLRAPVLLAVIIDNRFHVNSIAARVIYLLITGPGESRVER